MQAHVLDLWHAPEDIDLEAICPHDDQVWWSGDFLGCMGTCCWCCCCMRDVGEERRFAVGDARWGMALQGARVGGSVLSQVGQYY